MNVPLRKEEGSYTCSLRVGGKLTRYDFHPTLKEKVSVVHIHGLGFTFYVIVNVIMKFTYFLLSCLIYNQIWLNIIVSDC